MTAPKIVGPFVKAAASSQTDDCVSVAPTSDGGRAVRHSKNPEQGTQYYTPDEWRAFVQGVKGGEFDA